MRKSKNKKLIKLASKFQPWDYGFNLEIEQEMFRSMAEYFSSDKPMINDSDKVARYAKLAVNLLEIITEQDSAIELTETCSWVLVKYVNIRNAKRFINEDLISDLPIIKEEIRIQKAWYLYNKLRFQNMRKMWD